MGNLYKTLWKDLLSLCCVIALFLALTVWLFSDSDMERIRNITAEYKHMEFYGLKDESKEYAKNALQGEEGSLDLAWIGLVRGQNGYEQLAYFLRILAADPEREATYQEIGELLNLAPPEFDSTLQKRYVDDLVAVSGARLDYVEKYGLYPSKSED